MIKKISIISVFLCLSLNGSSQHKSKLTDDSILRKQYDSLAKVLAHIRHDDQKYRDQMESIAATYGGDSPEMELLGKKMKSTDSINYLIVSAIIDKYGWLGATSIGASANTTLFLVIQHATLEGQEKYLPVMIDAYKAGNAKGSSLALLEDRVALKSGRKQIYGSQISWNMKTNEYYVLALEDPDNVDKRRHERGLGSLADYIMSCCNLVWDVEAYKKSVHANEIIPSN